MLARPTTPPPFRRLRAFAFDPLASTELDMAGINEATLKVTWEAELKPGPVGEYLEVVDYDPASGLFYAPVNLNEPNLLAQDGLAPSESDPRFHQQMVYAVAMTTIRHFERALGRKALWSPRFPAKGETGSREPEFIPRLRCYPHALREANAFYSPDKKALLFGYFPASANDAGLNLPGGMIFTCLSHDIIAHETTHALLDGMHRRYVEASHPDALALHEAFADIVALFQHFTMPEAVRHQLARTRGDLSQQNRLGELARQFGHAIGNRGALRSAIGSDPDPAALDVTVEPHARGAILVAAVFDAFLAIYRTRVADLLRLVTGSATAFPVGDLHPDLLGRLADEANKSASHMLQMCIRALDYCPPVNVTFGDYLRGLITADEDLVADDDKNYRLAVIDAFRRRGIYPDNCRSLAIESLRWRKPRTDMPIVGVSELELGLQDSRQQSWDRSHKNGLTLWKWLTKTAISSDQARELGLALDSKAPATIERSRRTGLPKVEVHSVRRAHRAGPDGQKLTQLIVEITQSRRGYRTAELQEQAEQLPYERQPEPDFKFRGGCTLIIDLTKEEIRFLVSKNILSKKRLEQQRRHLFGGELTSLAATYFARPANGAEREPFALLHRGV